MAVTKTHPIKSTLKAAIDYICNPDKTDGKLLVSSFGCAAETADIEFEWTRRHAIDKGTHLGRHLIQAFEPGEVSPEEAHRIGMELAREVLGGKYEFVLTTHIDKDHVHNHLIFNAVSFTDHKHYHSNKRSYHEIRRASDRLCKEHGLSVIVPGRDKGKSYIEHQAAQNGTSYKAKLKAAIDRLIPVSSSLEDLLARLQREGYEIKRGKYISARAPDQERFTRLKTLGADYTEEAVVSRIAGGPRPSRQPQQRSGKVSLLIDIQNNIKAQQSAGYQRRATIENLKRAAATMNFLTEHGIGSYEELVERCDAVAAASIRTRESLRDTSWHLKTCLRIPLPAPQTDPLPETSQNRIRCCAPEYAPRRCCPPEACGIQWKIPYSHRHMIQQKSALRFSCGAARFLWLSSHPTVFLPQPHRLPNFLTVSYISSFLP